MVKDVTLLSHACHNTTLLCRDSNSLAFKSPDSSLCIFIHIYSDNNLHINVNSRIFIIAKNYKQPKKIDQVMNTQIKLV